jgi:hypothetical protein
MNSKTINTLNAIQICCLSGALVTCTIFIASLFTLTVKEASADGINVSSPSYSNRSVQSSTKAQRKSTVKMGGSGRGTISPYELTILKIASKQEKYSYKYAIWERKVANKQFKAAQKAHEQRSKAIARNAAQARKAQQEAEKRRALSNQSKPTKPVATATSTVDGQRRTTTGVAIIGEPAGDVEQPQSLSFFARVMKLFGF